MYASPSNPLGWVARAAEQDSLLEFCRRHGLWLLADEVYERIYFDGPVAPSILRRCTRDDAVIVVQSFSKSYCMTGWRLGWLTARADLVGQAAQLNEFIVSHAPSMVQRAGETALRRGEGFVQAMREQVARRVGACHRRLQSVRGCPWRRRKARSTSSRASRESPTRWPSPSRCCEERRVAVAPGSAFGRGGEGAVRICCAADESILEPAMERLALFIESGNRG